MFIKGTLSCKESRLYSKALIILVGIMGLVLGYPNSFFHFPPLSLLFPASIFFLSIAAENRKEAFAYSCFCSMLAFAGCLYWLLIPMHDVGGLPYLLAIPCVLLLSSYLALYPALFGLCIYAANENLKNYDRSPSPKPKSGRIILYTLLLSLSWAALELLSSIILTGFPWVSLSAAFAFWPIFIQLAALIGAYALSGLFVFISLLFCMSFKYKKSSEGKKLAALALFLALAIPSYGQLIVKKDYPQNGDSLIIGMVQGNIDQNQKWEPAYQARTLSHYINLSSQLIQKQKEKNESIDFLLWPETAMPFYYQIAEPYGSILRHFAMNEQTALAFGTLAFAKDLKNETVLYNRLQSISADGKDGMYYDKQHLVPFGEYLPFEIPFAFIQNILQGISFSAGTAKNPIYFAKKPRPHAMAESEPIETDYELLPKNTNSNELKKEGTYKIETLTAEQVKEYNDLAAIKNTDLGEKNISLGVLICYEAIFQSLAQERVKDGAELLVNISNDAWFGNSSAPVQHLSLAIMRAVEQKRPIVRATNTGYTTSIDPLGRLSKISSLFEDAALIVKVYPLSERSVYSHIASVLDYFLYAGLLITLYAALKRPKQFKN